MTESEARELLERLQFIIQKSRSNITEALAGYGKDLSEVEHSVVKMTNPILFPQDGENGFHVLDAITRILRKDEIEPIDLFNILTMCDQDPTIGFVSYAIWDIDLPQISPIPKWISGFSPDPI